jgi:uncharacterized membrane protein
MSYEFILGKFPGDIEQGPAQLERYDAAQQDLGIAEAAAFVKTIDGEEEVKVMGEDKKKARRIGAITGAVLGIVGGPPAMILFGLGGAAAGNLVSNLTHAGISKDTVEAVEEGLEPGSSAVLVIVEHGRHHVILNDLKDIGCVITNETVESHHAEKRFLMSPTSGSGETL